MPEIIRVGALDGNTLDIELGNGSSILLRLGPLLELPGFEELYEDDRILHPKTDGSAVYWRDGPRISIREIITILSGD